MIFNIKWTGGVWAITVFALIALVFSMYAVLLGSRIDWWYFKLPVTAIILIAIVLCGYMAPISLKLSDTQFKIHRLGRALSIPYGQIEGAGVFDFEPNTVRVWGSGGFFGFTGKFSNSELGIFTAYIGDTSKTFYVRTRGGKTYALSCEERELVVAKLREKIDR